MADSVQYSNDTNEESKEDNNINGQDSNSNRVVEFSEDEEMLISRMFKLVGERWSLIAGRIPGRTAEEIEKYWTSKYSSR